MKATTYFQTKVQPKIENYLGYGNDIFLLKASTDLTTHQDFNIYKYTKAYTPYIFTIRYLSAIIPVIACRDTSNVDVMGITIIGRPLLINFFSDILKSTIQAVERDVKLGKSLEDKSQIRFDTINEINYTLQGIKSNKVFNLQENRLLKIAEDYKKQISTLRIKKSFYGK